MANLPIFLEVLVWLGIIGLLAAIVKLIYEIYIILKN